MNALQKLAHFVCAFSLEEAPPEVARAARFCVLDTVGSALGAAKSEGTPELCRESLRYAGGKNDLQADVWGQGVQSDMVSALLLNGMMGHALELDDVHTGSKSHVGVVVVQTAWTLCDALGLGGKALLEAVVVGYEVMARAGLGMDVASNRKRGWHTTGVIGTFGAAAAACRLLSLGERETANALGIAAMQSAGLWAFLEEGATCKRLSPGRAAVNGLTAALLAKGGMTGPMRALDAKDGGLYLAVSDSFDMEAVTRGLGSDYAVLHIDKKPYPCCRTTHHAIDAAIAFHEAGVDPQAIDRITVDTYEVGVLQCGSDRYPLSPVEAKFSIAYTVACGLVLGRVTQGEFTQRVLDNPLIRYLAEHTVVRADEQFTARYPGRWGSRTTLLMKDASSRCIQIDDMSGSTRVPLSEKQEKDKFLGLAGAVFDEDEARRLMNDILRIDELERLPRLRADDAR